MPNKNYSKLCKFLRSDNIIEKKQFIEYVRPKHREELDMKNLLIKISNFKLEYNGNIKKIYDNYISMLIHRSNINRNYKKGGDEGHKMAQEISLFFLSYLQEFVSDEFKNKIIFDMNILEDMEDIHKKSDEIYMIVYNKSRYKRNKSISNGH